MLIKWALSVANACAKTLASHEAGFFGHLVIDLDIKASRRRHGAERADPRRRQLQAEMRPQAGEARK